MNWLLYIGGGILIVTSVYYFPAYFGRQKVAPNGKVTNVDGLFMSFGALLFNLQF